MTDTVGKFEGEYRFLSNFYHDPHHPLVYAWTYWPTAEHAYQAAKTSDPDAREAIRRASTARIAKQLGRSVDLVPHWDTRKFFVMHEILVAKFSAPVLSSRLQALAGVNLVEGNSWHDQVWGQCTCDEHILIQGQNWLGRLLMILADGGMK